AWAVFALLAVWSALSVAGIGGRWPGVPLAAAFGGFAALTLYLLAKRKRPKPDVTTLFWGLAMASLLMCALLYCLPPQALGAAQPLLLGILFIVGFAASAVNGMLYKIVPFLVWYHLQSVPGLERKAVPNVRQIVGERAAMQQFGLHLAGCALLAAAVAAPAALARPAALLLAVSACKLAFNLLGAARLYRRLYAGTGSSLVAA